MNKASIVECSVTQGSVYERGHGHKQEGGDVGTVEDCKSGRVPGELSGYLFGAIIPVNGKPVQG